jgi:pSer/pThr/pTyr-binding forkhead associated (FHA) protein
VGKSLQQSDLARQNEVVGEDARAKCQYSTICFAVWDNSTLIQVPLKDEISIGRSAPDTPIDVDLNPFNAHLLGVSRKHAIIKPLPTACVLIDLDSTNGTFINGNNLIPRQPYLLKSGDEIQIAGVYLQVSLY